MERTICDRAIPIAAAEIAARAKMADPISIGRRGNLVASRVRLRRICVLVLLLHRKRRLDLTLLTAA